MNSEPRRYAAGKAAIEGNLVRLADELPQPRRRETRAELSRFLDRREDFVKYVLQSAFGSVWTLELSPGDYSRIRGEIFPGLAVEDLGLTELSDELENFKKNTVLGIDAIAQLTSEIEKESGRVYRKPGIYQVTAFIEPLKSRLVFLGRTEEVERSMVWMSGLFLYQAWVGYVSTALEEASLALRSIRLGPSYSLTKAQLAKLSDGELRRLDQEFSLTKTFKQVVDAAALMVRSTLESASNMHKSLESLVGDMAFDVGLYGPILKADGRRLESAKDGVEKFSREFDGVVGEIEKIALRVSDESAHRKSELKDIECNP